MPVLLTACMSQEIESRLAEGALVLVNHHIIVSQHLKGLSEVLGMFLLVARCNEYVTTVQNHAGVNFSLVVDGVEISQLTCSHVPKVDRGGKNRVELSARPAEGTLVFPSKWHRSVVNSAI